MTPSGTTGGHSSVDEKKHHHSFFHHGGSDDKKAAAEEEQRRASESTSHSSSSNKKDDRTLGRKMKDKLTGKTHDERVAERKARAEREKREYDEYLRRRGEMLRAINQGQYRTAYSAPAGPYRVQPMYGGRYGAGYGYPRYGMYPAGPLGYGSGIGMGRAGMGTGMALGGGLLGASSVSLVAAASEGRLTDPCLALREGGLLLGDMMF